MVDNAPSQHQPNFYSTPRVVRQAGALGAYIYDINICDLPPDEARKLTRDALNEHQVICFRSQTITPDQHLAFARLFGDIYVQPSVAGKDGYPEMVEVRGTAGLTESWHSDSTHSRRPPGLSILVARRLPDFGNDTAFASQYQAYEDLSEGMKKLLAPLRAVHRTLDPGKVGSDAYVQTGVVEESVHPIVRTHAVTGRKAIYVSSGYTRSIEGLSAEEGKPILDFLYLHCTRPQYTWRHHWQPGDLLIWDNACVQHMVIGDRPRADGARLLDRVTVIGEEPY